MFGEFEYNKDWKKRDELIFGKADMDRYKWGGIARFEELTVEALQTMLDEGFADPDEQQNAAPSIKEIYEFMLAYPSFTAHGYTVSPERDDYRISIEGVNGAFAEQNRDMIADFTNLFREADEFDLGTMYCWFD